ncbi:hypothetical protein FT643_08915 [Ketobacter sp. MCCC 1A13808]|uniref:hypothetical protein n=1 Tax=Ketobacter sp. MCCC 1A13808 TaxID=2602738 RepID=UPI0012EBE495|nr:hypothetical protein [Ketobacter sp. MCCC 1A13808]MVF12266.1 hypothetical protein [Ketobacter sp. MCCC 1A13808]
MIGLFRCFIIFCFATGSTLVFSSETESTFKLIHGKQINGYTGKAVVINDDAIFVGDLVDGKPSGNGVMITDDKEVAYGRWVDASLEGSGAIISLHPRTVTAGKMHLGSPEGNGVLMFNDIAYEGPFKLGIPHGKGKCLKGINSVDCEYVEGKRKEQ